MKLYRNEKAGRRIMETYDSLLPMWETPYAERDVATRYGTTHVITCGDEGNPPLVLFHGVGDDSALMWLYNAKALSKRFRLYAVDTIGGPGKSRPNENYRKAFAQAAWLDDVFDSLGLDSAFLAGVSNGAYIAQHYAILRPGRARKIVCMSGSAVSDEAGKSPMARMLKVFLPEALFPTDRNVTKLIRKLTGDHYQMFTENAAVMAHYTWLLRGFRTMAMAYHKIKPFSNEQILSLKGRSLFLLGEKDPLGDKAAVEAMLKRYGLAYRYYPGTGHGINHEIPNEINQAITEYLLGM